MIYQWCVINIDKEVSVSIDPDCKVLGSYYYSFLFYCPSDSKKSDDTSRWWPDWYRFTRDSITNYIIFW